MAVIRPRRRLSGPPTVPLVPEVVEQGEKREDIAVAADAADTADDHILHEGYLAEPLPAGRVGEMHLDRRESAEEESVPDCHAGVCIPGGVDHHPVGRVPCPLERLHDLPFVVGLEELRRCAFPARGHRDGLMDGGEGLPAVETGYPLPQHVQVRPIDEQDPGNALPPHNISRVRRAACRSRKRHFPGTVPVVVTTTRQYSSVTRRTKTSARSPARVISPAVPRPFSVAIRSDSRKNRTSS